MSGFVVMSGSGCESVFSGDGVGASGVVSVFFVTSAGSCGNGIVISGFFLRIINMLVEMYIGRAANNSAVNTKPTKPYSCAFAR